MANLLIGLGIGLVAGGVVMASITKGWIDRYTKLYDQGKAAFGNKRYQEG